MEHQRQLASVYDTLDEIVALICVGSDGQILNPWIPIWKKANYFLIAALRPGALCGPEIQDHDLSLVITQGMGFPIQIQQGEIRCFLTDLQKCLVIHAAIITQGKDPQNLRIDVELDLIKESTLDFWLVLLSHHVETVLLEIQDGYIGII